MWATRRVSRGDRRAWWGVASPPAVVVRPGFSTIQDGGFSPASPARLPRPRRQPLYAAAPGPASYGSPSGRVSPSSSTIRRPGSVSSSSQKYRQSSHRYSNTPTPTSTAPCGHRVPSPRPTHSHSLTSPMCSTVRPPRPPQGVGPRGRTGVHSRHHAPAPANSPTSTPTRRRRTPDPITAGRAFHHVERAPTRSFLSPVGASAGGLYAQHDSAPRAEPGRRVGWHVFEPMPSPRSCPAGTLATADHHQHLGETTWTWTAHPPT